MGHLLANSVCCNVMLVNFNNMLSVSFGKARFCNPMRQSQKIHGFQAILFHPVYQSVILKL